MIHPTAIIHPGASIHPSAKVGPYAVIDEHVELGAECVVGPHVHLTGHTSIGERNRFHTGCVIGDAPQDLKYTDAPTRVLIGSENVFRENVTVHRATTTEDDTGVGSNNFFMAGSHVGHNARVGNHVILANGALLGGHSSVGDQAFLSGNCLVHQFVRVGSLALMQGGSAISKDLPPYTIARGANGICGLNIEGLRRAGFSSEERLELKKVYHVLFRSGQNLSTALSVAEMRFTSDQARVLLEFVATSRRGICADSGHSATEAD